MQRLVDRLMPLQSQSGWSVHLPSAVSSEVLQSAKQVLNALCRSVATSPPIAVLPTGTGVSSDLPKPRKTEWLRLQTFTPRLLWSTLRSSHEVMNLLAGSPARVSYPDRGSCTWQTGRLRLVPFVSLDCAAHESRSADRDQPYLYSMDLVANSGTALVLPPESRVYMDSTICPQPVTIAVLLQLIQNQVQRTTPAIAPMLQGIPVQMRLPQQSYQRGMLQLHYRLEFQPSLVLAPSASILVKFAETGWLQRYTEAIHQQQIAQVSAQLVHQANSCRDLSPLAVILKARTVADTLQNDLAIVSRLFAVQELQLTELGNRLRWGLMHAGYEVMQLLRGVPVTLPHPSTPQLMGRLRFVVHLRLRSPDHQWTLDLMSGRLSVLPASPEPCPPCSDGHMESVPLLPATMVQSQVCAWCQPPRSLHQLQTMLWSWVKAQTPELALLRQPTPIELYPPERQAEQATGWQTGTIQLQGQFEFVPTTPCSVG
jgi:hypothetical protein